MGFSVEVLCQYNSRLFIENQHFEYIPHKTFKESFQASVFGCFLAFGKSSQTLDPKNETLYVPLYTVFTVNILNLERCHPANISLFTVNRSTRKSSEICSKFIVFIVNFEHFLHLFPVFLLLTWNK